MKLSRIKLCTRKEKLAVPRMSFDTVLHICVDGSHLIPKLEPLKEESPVLLHYMVLIILRGFNYKKH